MVKRYYCDYCNKSFQDNPQSRKRHLNGISHQRNRRLHYDSVMVQLAAVPPASHHDVLYTSVSGEEILQQWLAKHPEVLQKHQEIKAKLQKLPEKQPASDRDKSEQAAERGRVQTPAISMSTQQAIPAELQPYGDMLPPSLLPPAMRVQFPGSSSGVSDWG